jgi:hypothetical protein
MEKEKCHIDIKRRAENAKTMVKKGICEWYGICNEKGHGHMGSREGYPL